MGGVLATGWSRPTERKGREMKRRKGDDVPGYGAAEIFTRDGAALLLPVSEVNALKEARVAAREAITNSLAEAAALRHRSRLAHHRRHNNSADQAEMQRLHDRHTG